VDLPKVENVPKLNTCEQTFFKSVKLQQTPSSS